MFGEIGMAREFSIIGMSCNHCVKAITESFYGVPGITSFELSLEQKKLTLEGDISDDKVVSLLDSIGYVGVANAA